MQSLQGEHRSTPEGGNESELTGQIPMALQGAPAAGSTEELCQLLKNRGQLFGHVLLPRLELSKQWGSAWTGEKCENSALRAVTWGTGGRNSLRDCVADPDQTEAAEADLLRPSGHHCAGLEYASEAKPVCVGESTR